MRIPENDNQALEAILEHVPTLLVLQQAPSLRKYIQPAFDWKAPAEIFPFRQELQKRIIAEASRLYGTGVADIINDQLSKHFILETAIHLSLPKGYDSLSRKQGLLTTSGLQGLILSAAAHYAHGAQYHVSFSSGRISLNNDNSASTFQISVDHAIRTHPSRLNRTPQMFLPKIGPNKVEELIALRENNRFSEDEETRIDLAIKAIQQGDTFTDQILRCQSGLIHQVLENTNIKHIALEYEALMLDCIADILEDERTSLHAIFSDPEKTKEFIHHFQGIKTGWKENETPFQNVENDGLKVRMGSNYEGSLDIETLTDKLRNREILPKGVLVYYCFMIEAGLLPLGGMHQTTYCTEIRDRAVEFLKGIQEDERAEYIQSMPTEIAVMTPVWGLVWGLKQGSDGSQNLINYEDFLNNEVRLTNQELISILDDIKGTDSLLASLPVLKEQILKKKNNGMNAATKPQGNAMRLTMQ